MPPKRNWRRVEQYLAALETDRLHEDPRGRRWCVHDRLVARQVDDSTLLIRSDFGPRERLLDRYPATFSVRPDLEAHMKVLADIDHGDVEAICAALHAAWQLQRAASR
ncbi:MAG: hypothetical protein ACRDPG_13045 [Nocardioidaceae bacterium]